MNAHGRIVLVDAQTDRLFGYRRDELHGKTIEVLVPRRFPDVRVHCRFRSFNDPRQRAMGADLELYGLRKDGQEFPVEISLSPFETEDGVRAQQALEETARALEEAQEELARKERAG